MPLQVQGPGPQEGQGQGDSEGHDEVSQGQAIHGSTQWETGYEKIPPWPDGHGGSVAGYAIGARFRAFHATTMPMPSGTMDPLCRTFTNSDNVVQA